MKEGFLTSSEEEPCIKCKDMTNSYITFEKEGVKIQVPICQDCLENISLPREDISFSLNHIVNKFENK